MNLTKKLDWRLDTYLDSQMGDYAQARHALLHLMKATGGVADTLEPLDHNLTALPPTNRGLAKYLADVVICAVRIANLFHIDLELAVTARVREKMGSS